MHISAKGQKKWNVLSLSASLFKSARQNAISRALLYSPYACTMASRWVLLGWWTLVRPSSTGRSSPWLSVCTALSLGSSFLLAATTYQKWGVKSFNLQVTHLGVKHVMSYLLLFVNFGGSTLELLDGLLQRRETDRKSFTFIYDIFCALLQSTRWHNSFMSHDS